MGKVLFTVCGHVFLIELKITLNFLINPSALTMITFSFDLKFGLMVFRDKHKINWHLLKIGFLNNEQNFYNVLFDKFIGVC